MTGEGETNLPTSNARTQRIIANTDLLVHDVIGEIVPAASHGAYKDCDVVCRGDGREVFRETGRFSVSREGWKRGKRRVSGIKTKSEGGRGVLILKVFGGRWSVTGFCDTELATRQELKGWYK